MRLGWTRLRWQEKRLEVVSSVCQLRDRQGLSQELEREWGLGQEPGQASACLRVKRSSEHQYGEFKDAQTGFQECNRRIWLLPSVSFVLCDDHVVQHGAAVLLSQVAVSEMASEGECESE